MDRTALARMIDHTLLDPAATPGQIAMFCGDAVHHGVGAICVAPNRLPLPHPGVGDGIATCTVIGFPTGAHRPEVKAAEAAQAAADGAEEVDVVIDLGLASAGLWHQVEAGLRIVRAAVPSPVVLKIIIEAAALPSREAIVAACHAAEAADADFVKTSTGMHPAGGASLADVRIIAEAVGGRLGIKAAGGIRDLATTLALIDAGATRIGTSHTSQILADLS